MVCIALFTFFGGCEVTFKPTFKLCISVTHLLPLVPLALSASATLSKLCIASLAKRLIRVQSKANLAAYLVQTVLPDESGALCADVALLGGTDLLTMDLNMVGYHRLHSVRLGVNLRPCLEYRYLTDTKITCARSE